MKIALVSPPWPLFNRPSIQIGALKAFLNNNDKSLYVKNFHPYLKISKALGYKDYHIISQSSWASEAVFSKALFSEINGQEAVFKKALGKRFKKKGLLGDFHEIARACQKVLDEYLEEKALWSFDLVGISICLNQLTAGLYIARKIKEQSPETKVLLGGSSVSGPMGKEILKAFYFVDFVISGEGEIPLYEICQKLKKKKTIEKSFFQENCQVDSLDSLPPPDYDDFFNELNELGTGGINPVLPLEASRGCWWGRCAFCNLNLQWKGYRSKSPKRISKEVDFLSKRYGQIDFAFMDNCLPRKEASTIFEEFWGHRRDYRFFAEIRAVHGRKELSVMKKAGLKDLQVGIEALSTSLLKRLRKGATAIKNIAIIKNSMEFGLNLGANIITCFPGSSKKEIEETLFTLDYIWPFCDLKPVDFWLGTGSPVSESPRDFGIGVLRPHRYYEGLFPRDIINKEMALILEYRGDRLFQKRQWKRVEERLLEISRKKKKIAHLSPFLTYRDGGDFLLIRQVTLEGKVLTHRLKGLSREIYLFFMEPRSLDELFKKIREVPKETIKGFLEELFRKRLVFIEGDRVLSLAFREAN